MKRKRFDKRGWRRVTDGEQRVVALPGGLLVDYRAGRVTQPLDVPFAGETLRILDSGYRWVHYAPRGEAHALTVQLDAVGRAVQLYVDIGAGNFVAEDGLPWTLDLYLDVLAQVDAAWHVTATEIIDGDELEVALLEGDVSPEQAAQAWAEARRVEQALRRGELACVAVVREYLRLHP